MSRLLLQKFAPVAMSKAIDLLLMQEAVHIQALGSSSGISTMHPSC